MQASVKTKGLVFILDGLGDRPCPQLDGKTPLEAAHTPVLDALAAGHQCGLMDPLTPGLAVDTHTGVGILFGLPPEEAAHLRRGPIEAAGVGLKWRPGDVLWRGNLASVEKTPQGFRILDRRAGRIRTGVPELCAALGDMEVAPGVTASLHPATQHRTVLRFRGDGLSAEVSDTDPGGDHIALGILTAEPRPASPAGARAAQATADALNRFTRRAHEILDRHPLNAERIARGRPPANGVIVRSAGVGRRLKKSLTGLGLKVAAVAGETTILGLAELLDFHCHHSPRFTSLPDTDLGEKLRTAARSLERHDLVFVHLKGTDTAAHDKNPRLKTEFIARFDRELGNIDLGRVVVGVCADHCTDSVSGEHTGDPVPVLLCGPGGRRDSVTAYNEDACVGGALGRVTAREFMRDVLTAMGVFARRAPAKRRRDSAGARRNAGLARE